MAIPDIPFNTPATATGKLVKFFFESLPAYFKANDSYPVSGEGLLERYLSTFQTESEQYITDLENLVTLPHPALTQARFLDYIGEFFGRPADTFGNLDHYSDLLDNIIRINQNRGTVESIQNFFKVMGTDCTIAVEYATYFRHDEANEHDDTDVHHDGYCFPCVGVTLDVLDPTNIITQLNVGTLTQDTRRIVQSILVYFLPVNANLTHFKYNGVTKNIAITDGNLVPLTPSGGALPT